MKEYTIVYTSNFMNHYQLAIGNELSKVFKNYYFIADTKLPGERSKLGFFDLNDSEYVIKAYEDKEKARQMIMNADVVLCGCYKHEEHIRERLKAGKLVIYSSERLFKTTNIVGTILRYIKYWTKYHSLYKDVNLLCISAYTAGDYARIFNLFKDRAYKWGYFSETIVHDEKQLMNNKKKNSIIWAGRLIKWKHPEYAIELAKKLKKDNYDFELNIIGNGRMENQLKKMINDYNLSDCVHMLGSMNPNEVRKHMEESEIYLFTSDRGEGWGVVLNEAMNSGCACVASYSTGATPFLIKDNENGLVYKSDNFEELYSKTKYLLDNKDLINRIGINGYRTIKDEWGPDMAAKRLYEFVDTIINTKEKSPIIFEDGILSKANDIR